MWNSLLHLWWWRIIYIEMVRPCCRTAAEPNELRMLHFRFLHKSPLGFFVGATKTKKKSAEKMEQKISGLTCTLQHCAVRNEQIRGCATINNDHLHAPARTQDYRSFRKRIIQELKKKYAKFIRHSKIFLSFFRATCFWCWNRWGLRASKGIHRRQHGRLNVIKRTAGLSAPIQGLKKWSFEELKYGIYT